MPVGVKVGLSPGHVVLDWDPAPPPKGAQPQLWPNGWMDQDATWYEGRPRPRLHCVIWGSSSPKMGIASQSSLALQSPEVLFWHRLTRVVPENGPSNGCGVVVGLLWPNDRPSQLLLSTCGFSDTIYFFK